VGVLSGFHRCRGLFYHILSQDGNNSLELVRYLHPLRQVNSLDLLLRLMMLQVPLSPESNLRLHFDRHHMFYIYLDFATLMEFQPNSLRTACSAFSACTSSLFLMTFTAICLAFRILGAIAAPFVMQGGGEFCLFFLLYQGILIRLERTKMTFSIKHASVETFFDYVVFF
jgi:hypothetical protein